MCESPLPKCFVAKLCILVSVICVFGSPKTDVTFGDDFKGRVKIKISLHKATGSGNNVKSLCTKLHCARDQLRDVRMRVSPAKVFWG